VCGRPFSFRPPTQSPQFIAPLHPPPPPSVSRARTHTHRRRCAAVTGRRTIGAETRRVATACHSPPGSPLSCPPMMRWSVVRTITPLCLSLCSAARRPSDTIIGVYESSACNRVRFRLRPQPCRASPRAASRSRAARQERRNRRRMTSPTLQPHRFCVRRPPTRQQQPIGTGAARTRTRPSAVSWPAE